MSPRLPPAPTGTGLRVCGPEEPKSLPDGSEPKSPPPPTLSSMVSCELKPCRSTSVDDRSCPSLSCHLLVCSEPSRYTFEPFLRYCSTTLQSPSLNITTRCHSVFSRRSPVALSRQVSLVATRRLAIGRPSCVRRISGSAPRLPMRITLLTEPAMSHSPAAMPRTCCHECRVCSVADAMLRT